MKKRSWKLWLGVIFLGLVAFYGSRSLPYVFVAEYENADPKIEAQLFWSDGNSFQEDSSGKGFVRNGLAVIRFNGRAIENLRFDPVMQQKPVEIKKITIKHKYFPVGEFEVVADNLATAFVAGNCQSSYDTERKLLLIMPENNDPQLLATAAFMQAYKDKMQQMQQQCLWMAFFVWLGLTFVVGSLYFMQRQYGSTVLLAVKANRGWLGEKAFYYRWRLAAVFLVLAVFFEIHGSSIGLYADFLGYPEYNTAVLGANRPIRSDEWAVFTPFTFSQYYNHLGKFSYFSDIIRGTISDVFLVYGLPVLDIAMVFRPFQWGYLFLPPGAGLSFFWLGRWLALCLISFEMGQLLTDKKKLSVGFTLLVAFAPVVQWWFAINSFVEILLFGQGAVLLLNLYMNTVDYRRRLLYGSGIIWCMGVYLFAIYPAWQVPFAYIFLVLAIWVFKKNRKCFLWDKRDVLLFAVGGGVSIFPAMHAFMKSWEMIQVTKATVYPGTRFMLGGGMSVLDLFLYPLNIFLPFSDVMTQSNNCEAARFFDFAPLGWIMAGIYFFRQRKSDFLLVLLLLLDAFFLAWGLSAWPAWIAKYTLLYNCGISRMLVPLGFLHILILVRSLSLLEQGQETVFFAGMIAAGSAVFGTAVLAHNLALFQLQSFYLLKLAVTFLLLLYSFWCIARRQLMALTVCIIGISVFSGAMVNPLAHGVDSVYRAPVARMIEKIAADDPALWLVVDAQSKLNNYPIMLGAPTINSVNIYPALTRWESLDERQMYRDVYNRYAHISVLLTTEPATSFTLNLPDYFTVHLNINDLKKLSVKYILTYTDLKEYRSSNIEFIELFRDRGLIIYQVKYLSGE